MTLALPACLKTNLLENRAIPSGKHTIVIMPGQTCAKQKMVEIYLVKTFYTLLIKSVIINNLNNYM